jgi:glycosyltransferase involved in cell wall biosynthesis
VTKPVIAQILPALNIGGVEQTTIDIAQALLDNNFHALIISEGGGMVSLLEEMGAEHIKLPLATKNPFKIIANIFKLKKLFQQKKVSLVHARSRAPGWSSYIAAKLCKLPFITTYHGIYNQGHFLKKFYNSVMARGDAVIANSHFTAHHIAQSYPFAQKNITTIHRGTNLIRFRPQSVSERRRQILRELWQFDYNTKVIVQIARLTKWKGQNIAIEAFAEIAPSYPDYVLVLVGDAQGRDAYQNSLYQLARKLNIADSVIFAGHQSDIPAILSMSACCLVTSIEPEAFGRAAIEAQAMGIPVIVTNHGAVAETVIGQNDDNIYYRNNNKEEQNTGFLVPPNDREGLAKILNQVLSLSLEEKSRLAKRARAHCETHFGLPVMTKATIALYEALLKNHSANNRA